MKVSDVMRRSIIKIPKETPLKEVARLIFSLSLSMVPVVSGNKLIGIVTQEDILSNMFPTMSDVVDDYVHTTDFADMERNLSSILETPIENMMNTNFTAVDDKMPLMQAQSVILRNNFSHLPIVDKDMNLLGVLSQGDIFRHLIRNEMPRLERERYAGFIANYYDLMVNWEKRFSFEFPPLFDLFRKKQVKKILDLGVWTGKYTTEIVKRGDYKALGLDHNPIMIKISEEKRNNLPSKIRKNLQFMLTDFKDLPSKINEKYDAAICMGNSLPYIPADLDELFFNVLKILRDRNSILVLQVLNFDKILKNKNRLLSFQTQKSKEEGDREHLFIEFLDDSQKNKLLHNVIIFDSDGKNWIFKGITTIEVKHLRQEDIERSLWKAGYKSVYISGNIGEYQGDYGSLSFSNHYNPDESDWMNILAVR